MNLLYIELTHILEDPEQPRKQHSEESLRGLADSLRQHGMLNPITVTPLSGDRYQIVTGERRWRAAGMAHLDTIPCVVREVSADETLTEQLIENLQREDLQPLEKARALSQVKKAINLTNRELAKRLGLSERTIGYLLDLLELPENIGEAIVSSPNRKADGQLTEKHARFLKQLNDAPELQSAVVERIREDRMSSEDTGNLVKALKKRPEKSQEILSSPADHLTKFFQDGPDPLEALLGDLPDDDAPMRLSPHAQRVLDFLPILAGIKPAQLSVQERRQIEDALTSLGQTVEALLRDCRETMGG